MKSGRRPGRDRGERMKEDNEEVEGDEAWNGRGGKEEAILRNCDR